MIDVSKPPKAEEKINQLNSAIIPMGYFQFLVLGPVFLVFGCGI
jgi:hypothetical protein